MKINILLIISVLSVWLISTESAKSQNFLAFSNDNYSGATGMMYQPASIADSRYKFDMEVFAASSRIENNWWSVDHSVLFNFKTMQDSNFRGDYLTALDNKDR